MNNLLITGGSGFLGKNLVKSFTNEKKYKIYYPSSKECDCTKIQSLKKFIKNKKINIIVHCAGFIGGINFSRLYPDKVFTNNLQMTTNVFEISKEASIEKLIFINSACVYSDHYKKPFKEEQVWERQMHKSARVYGISKYAALIGADAFSKYNKIYINTILTNLYGPGDKFDEEESHVIPSLISKFQNAKKKQSKIVELWGTGETIREFIYIEDCCKILKKIIKNHKKSDLINIGTGYGIKVKKLAKIISKLCNYKGNIVWNKNIENGSLYKVLSIKKLKNIYKYKPETDMDDGLRKTISWYEKKYL